MAKISVVIGTLGRIELLKGTLEALYSQQFPPKDFEILIVTNGNEAVRGLVASRPKPKELSVRLVYCSYQWVAPKRNIGIRLAKNPIVAFIDDDCIADAFWLSVISKEFDENPLIVGLEGRTEKTAKGLFEHATENLRGGLYPTCNLAFRRSILEEIQGFDEAYTYHREDTDLAYKALSKGQIPFCPQMKVFHTTRSTSWQAVIKEVRWVRGDVRLYKKFPGRYGKAFGFPAKGAIKQGLFSWALFFAALFGWAQNPLLICIPVIAFLFFSYLTVLSRRTWTIPRVIPYIFLSYLRNLLFLPSFAYYWITLSKTELPGENPGWNQALAFKPEDY